MFRGNAELLQKEQAAIERRRKAEEERKQRILDPKTRQFAVDVNAIAEQLKQKEEAAALEKQRNALYDQQAVAVEQQVIMLERAREMQRREEQKQLNDFRLSAQTKDQRREYDLYDPAALKKDIPARIGDEDPRLGASSLQKFDGEDLAAGERKRAQQEQLKRWVASQIAEKEGIKAEEKALNQLYEARSEEIAYLASRLEQERDHVRSETLRAQKDYNLQKAQVTSTIKDIKKQQELEANLEEIRNMLDSDLLNERFDSTISAADPSRFKKYHFKGFSKDMVDSIAQERAGQLADAARRKEEEKERERLQLIHDEMVLRQSSLLEREQLRSRKAAHVAVKAENLEQSAEFKERYSQLFKQTYANKVTPEFFNQFGTSSRITRSLADSGKMKHCIVYDHTTLMQFELNVAWLLVVNNLPLRVT